MGPRDVALAIKNWAKRNSMIAGYPDVPPVDETLIREVFHGAGIANATHALQNRGVSYIGVNDTKNEVVVFTTKKLLVKDERALRESGVWSDGSRIAVTFMHSDVLRTGSAPPPPVGVPPFHEHNGRYTCGSSIYIGSEKGAGTFGCLVQDAGGQMFGLSNNHVSGGSNYALPGLPIVAPGILDVAAGGRDPVTLGHHYSAQPFIDGLPEIVDANPNLDAAIFALTDPDLVSSMQRDKYDTPAQCEPMTAGMAVSKVGRTSAQTHGEVIAELFDFEPVTYLLDMIGGKKVVFFKSMFMIKNKFSTFSWPGDSGSLITTTDADGNKAAVGIVVAGNEEGFTLALSLDRILNHFGVNLVSGHNI